MRDVYIVGEDEATKAVIIRLLREYAPNLHVLGELPARGSQIKSKIANFNQLASRFPVILLTDLDDEPCGPICKTNLLNKIVQQQDFIINIAIDEVEAWLMADKDGFSRYFGIPLAQMPVSTMQKMSGRRSLPEISVPLKSSWYLTHNLEVPGSSPSWSTLKIKELRKSRNSFFLCLRKQCVNKRLESPLLCHR